MRLKYWLLHQVMQRGRNHVKKKGPLIGQHFTVPRSGVKSVKTILYCPQKSILDLLPTLFNVHGGAWVGGDATTLDSQSQYIADRLGCFVVNINYTKLDVEPFPYPQQEIRDTVLYFRDHAKEYGIDITRFSLIGYSAGGHLCAGTAILLRDAGFELNSQFLCYPFLDFTSFGVEGLGMEHGKAEKAEKLMDELFSLGWTNLRHCYLRPVRQERHSWGWLRRRLLPAARMNYFLSQFSMRNAWQKRGWKSSGKITMALSMGSWRSISRKQKRTVPNRRNRKFI